MARIKMSLGIGISNAVQEGEIFIEDAIWDAMTPEEQETELAEIAYDFGGNYIDLAAWVV